MLVGLRCVAGIRPLFLPGHPTVNLPKTGRTLGVERNDALTGPAQRELGPRAQ
jgi:hypothetical protein